MDEFKKKSLINYGYELEYANELGKKRLRNFEKKHNRKLSRVKLKIYDRKLIKNYDE